MNNNEPLYSVLVLFGKEVDRSVASPDVLKSILEPIVDLLQTTKCKLEVRGTVQGEKGKNLAPKKGPWSPELLDKWTATLVQSQGRFMAIELFDQAWAPGHHPDVFVTVHKLWGYGPEGYTERTKEGAENNVTVAIRDGLLDHAFERLEATARLLVEKICCFYGSVESNVPWDRPRRRAREDMIDIRWYNRTIVDYRRGTSKVEETIPRLYCGNILSRSQFANLDVRQLAKLPGVVKVEEWPLGLIFLRLAEQPEYRAKPPHLFSKFIRFVPA